MDMFAKTSKFVVLGIVIVVIAWGCGTREPVVARVGREKITVKEFKDAFIQRFHTEDNAKHQSYAMREKVVHDMAVDLAKYQEGQKMGIEKKPEVAHQLEQSARRKALDMLYEDKVINAVITDAAAKDFYDKSGEEVKARHILLKTSPVDSLRGDSVRVKARIDSIKQAINNGLSFKAAAKMFSEDATSAADSGNLDWFQWGRMVDEFQNAAWGAKPGQMVGPVRTSYGYHLILVEDRRPIQGRGSFEDSKQSIKSQLRQVEGEKLGKQARDYVDNLHKTYSLKYNDANIELFRKKMQDPNTPKNQDLGTVFTADQKPLEVATYKGGKVTIDSLIAKIGPNAHRVDWSNPQTMKDLINSMAEPVFLERDAESQGYYKKALDDPAVKNEIRHGIIGQLEAMEVTDKIKPTEDDDRRYYESHLSGFIQPEMRTIREIFIKSDSIKAARIRDRALKGEDFKKLAQRFNEKESTQPDTGRIGPFEEQRFGLIGKAAFMLQKPGDISAVTPSGKNYSVIQLLDIQPSRTKTFEEALPEAKRQDRQAMTDAAMKALEDKSLNDFKLTIDEKALSAVWPLEKDASNPASGENNGAKPK
jgi:parvulin-like peptidyl-prolyl isomerase